MFNSIIFIHAQKSNRDRKIVCEFLTSPSVWQIDHIIMFMVKENIYFYWNKGLKENNVNAYVDNLTEKYSQIYNNVYNLRIMRLRAYKRTEAQEKW